MDKLSLRNGQVHFEKWVHPHGKMHEINTSKVSHITSYNRAFMLGRVQGQLAWAKYHTSQVIIGPLC